jgi:hypothetical protein
MSESTFIERLQTAVQEFADVLLHQRPPGTAPQHLWEEALSLDTLPDNLPASQELLAYGAAVKRARITRNVQGPVAHPCAAEALNRHGEMLAAGNNEATRDRDELPVCDVQAHGAIGVP